MAQSDESGCGLVFAGVVLFAIFAPSNWTNSVWCAVQFGVSPTVVHSEDKPKDCDFIHAPLGDKGCSYKANATAYNADGVPLRGENPPKFGKDTNTGKTIISYDGGKNWDWYVGTSAEPDKITTVTVTWKRELS
jgi:hypothetical protein